MNAGARGSRPGGYIPGMSLERFTRKIVIVADAAESAAQVARKMLDHHVGAVVVMEGGKPAGIVTDRDLALRVIAAGVDPNSPVSAVMSKSLVTARADELVDQVAHRMRMSGVRRLPLVDANGALVGLVALDDLYVLLAGELMTTAQAVIGNRGP